MKMKLGVMAALYDLRIGFGELRPKTIQSRENLDEEGSAKAVFFQYVHNTRNAVVVPADLAKDSPIWVNGLELRVFPSPAHGTFRVNGKKYLEHGSVV
jgi:hypothetical protein